MASATDASASGSRWAVGSSRTTRSASRRNARATAIRCRWPPLSLTPSSPMGVSRPSGRSSMNAVAPAARAAAGDLVEGRVRPGQADVLGDRPVEQVGRLRDVRDPAAPGVDVDVGEGLAADGDPARVRIDEPQQQPREGRLAGPRLADDRRPPAGRQDEVDVAKRGFRAARVGEGDAVQDDVPEGARGLDGQSPTGRPPAALDAGARRRRVEDLEDPRRGLAACGAFVVGRGEPAQRHEELRRDDQHGERRRRTRCCRPSAAGSAPRPPAPSPPRRQTRARGWPGTRSAAPSSSSRRSGGRSRGSGPPARGCARTPGASRSPAACPRSSPASSAGRRPGRRSPGRPAGRSAPAAGRARVRSPAARRRSEGRSRARPRGPRPGRRWRAGPPAGTIAPRPRWPRDRRRASRRPRRSVRR